MVVMSWFINQLSYLGGPMFIGIHFFGIPNDDWIPRMATDDHGPYHITLWMFFLPWDNGGLMVI